MHILMLVIALLFAAPVADKPDCREVERITGGVELEWLGYEQGGWDLPDDLTRSNTVYFAVGGIWIYTADSEPGVQYLWWFGDFEISGEPKGYHNFCAVRVITD